MNVWDFENINGSGAHPSSGDQLWEGTLEVDTQARVITLHATKVTPEGPAEDLTRDYRYAERTDTLTLYNTFCEGALATHNPQCRVPFTHE